MFHASGALIRMQRFFSQTTMPATDWRTPLYSHEPASTSLATRASKTRDALGSARDRAFGRHRFFEPLPTSESSWAV